VLDEAEPAECRDVLPPRTSSPQGRPGDPGSGVALCDDGVPVAEIEHAAVTFNDVPGKRIMIG
jgi:hypothetical protein